MGLDSAPGEMNIKALNTMNSQEPQMFFGNVMHGRLLPKRNLFSYSIYYLSFPLSQIKKLPIAYNQKSWMSFYDRDHGHCDGSNIETWARDILATYNIHHADGEIILVCMPRILV